MKRFVSILVLALLVLALACSKDEPTKPKSGPPELPQPVLLTGPGTKAPAKITGTINSFNAYMNSTQSYLQMIAQISPSGSDGTYTWSAVFEGATLTVKSVLESDGSISWYVIIDGKTSDGTQYNNWTAVRGTISADGNYQEWYIYEPNSTTASVKMTWKKDKNNNVTSVLEYPATNDKLQVVNNSDGSGSYTEYISGVKRYEAIWNADGSGTYKEWDANGQLVQEGSW